ncbi:MAG: hypothetical protein ACI85K_002180 [Hyphomicrobiaceae bacterium]|jgi:hypothetical protein
MRILLALIACALIGLVGFVVMKEQQRGAVPAGPRGIPTTAAIDTVSNGEAVDIASIVPASGLTIVCFSADF